MTNRFFIDTDIWVYAFSHLGDTREDLARDFIASTIKDASLPVVSHQVINETSRALKKIGTPESELRQIVETMFGICGVVDFGKDTALIASNLRETVSASYWDSLIIASALIAGCDTLASEDMQDGIAIRNSLTIRNVLKP